MNNVKHTVALIGYGGMADYHITRWLSKRDDTVVAGIYDINEEKNKKAEANGLHAYASREELLSDEAVDLVVVAIPNDVHKEVVIDALAHGKNVVCEKPVAMSSAELEEMIAASKKYGKIFTVDQNRRWDPDYLTMKKIFDEGTLGRVFQIESRVHGSNGIPGDWRNKKEHGGGMVLDWGIHIMDQMLMMMGSRKIVSVYAKLTNVSNDEVDDGFKVLVKFDDGIEWQLEVGTNNFINLPRWYMLGENGSAQIDDWQLNGKIVMVTDWENREAVPVVAGAGLTKTMAPRTADTIDTLPLPEIKADITEYYTNVYRAIEGKETQLITHDQLRRSFKLMETVFKSAEKDEVIKEVF